MRINDRVAIVTAVVAVLGIGSVVADSRSGKRAPRQPPDIPGFMPPAGDFGAPLAGLAADQLEAFAEGREEFGDSDTQASGLGPAFNGKSCAECHSLPAIGGSSTILETRFGRTVNGAFDPLTRLGGSLLQQSAISPSCQEVVPPEANVVAKRLTTPLFGAGLIEAIPDQAILANVKSSWSDKASGRASIVADVATGQTRVGRFGWKAQQATLLAFAGDAYINEMGITNRLFPHENAPNGDAAKLAACDGVADVEDETDPTTGRSDIDLFADFMRLLGPPPQLPSTQASRDGQKLFADVGCADCHLPSMSTGWSPIGPLRNRRVNLYSDLLLHDMGSLGDGIAQGTATPTEMRTAPLWGLRARSILLHDGRATTVDGAIRQHDGEGRPARESYLRLSPAERTQLLQFLQTI